MFQGLLHNRDMKVSSKPFQLNGRKWSYSKLTRVLLTAFGVFRRIDVHHLFDGRLGAALYNVGVTRTTAHFAVTLVNQNSQKNVVEGDIFLS